MGPEALIYIRQAATPSQRSLPTHFRSWKAFWELSLLKFQFSTLICRSLSKYSSATIQRPFILRPRKATVKKPCMVLFPPRRKAWQNQLKTSLHPNNRSSGNRRNIRPNILDCDEIPDIPELALNFCPCGILCSVTYQLSSGSHISLLFWMKL